MELTSTERMLLEMLQAQDAEAQRQSQQRLMRFMAGISERVGIPVDVLGINPHTGEITDARIASADRVVPDVEPLDQVA